MLLYYNVSELVITCLLNCPQSSFLSFPLNYRGKDHIDLIIVISVSSVVPSTEEMASKEINEEGMSEPVSE